MTTPEFAASVLGRPRHFKAHTVTTPDGVAIHAQEWGHPSGPEIVFVHGFSQSHLSWLHQVTGPLASRFRIITYDNRGHGKSDKPTDPAAYRDGALWAGELGAVIAHFGLKRPVVAAWSYAGRILMDYLANRGGGDLAGVAFIAATSTPDPVYLGPAFRSVVPRMISEDVAESILGTAELLRIATARPLPSAEFEFMLGFNMMVPAQVRGALGGRPMPPDEVLRSAGLPTLVLHGSEDRINLVTMADHTAKVAARSEKKLYGAIGHLLFWEDPERFDRDLGTFVAGLSGG